MEQREAHPLDIDLLSVALGEDDVALTSQVNDHLGTCLLCRVRIARIRRSGAVPEPLVASGIQYPSVSPEVLAVLDSTVRAAEAAPGQLWLAGESHRMLVWIDAIEDDTAFVYAVTLDVDSADDTAVVASLTKLGRPAAIFTSVGGTVPLERLVSYVDDLAIHADVERLIDAAAEGSIISDLNIGEPITGATDERLELRQLLADDLAALDPIAEDSYDEPLDGGPRTSVVQGLRDHIRHDLLWRRGPNCQVDDVDEFAVGSYAHGITIQPVVRIREVGCVVLLVTGERGADWVLENGEVASLILQTGGATALAVAEPLDPYDTCLFERSDLRYSYELPLAAVKSPPRIGTVAEPLVKALDTYLDRSAYEVQVGEPIAHPSTTPDPSPHLVRNARTYIASLKATRATMGKNRALKNLTEADADAVAAALASAADFDDLTARLDQVVDR